MTVGNERYDRPRNQILLPGLRARRGSTRGTVSDAPSTYYGRPMIKAPHWKWYVPGYFFIAGIAAGVAFFGALARSSADPAIASPCGMRATSRSPSRLSARCCSSSTWAGHGASSTCCASSRCARRSALARGFSWRLASRRGCSRAEMAEDGFILRRRSFLSRLALLLPDRLLTLLQGALGLGLGGYTGVLLAATAVPLWAAAGILLGPLFLAASITSGAAALILLGLLSGRQSRAARADLEIVASVGAITQLGLAAAHEAFVPERIGQPLRHGVWGRVFRYGVVGRRTDCADGAAVAGLAQWRTHGAYLLGAERDLHRALGIATDVPLLGYVFDETWAEAHRDDALALVRVSRKAKQLLADFDAEWEALRPLMKAPDDATFRALRDGFRAGIPRAWGEAERADAARLFAVMARLGGDAVGKSHELQPGTFWSEVVF